MFKIKDVSRLIVFSAFCSSVGLAQRAAISFNDTIPSKTSHFSKPRNCTAVNIQCQFSDFMSRSFQPNSYFAINIFRCLYTDYGNCANTTNDKKGSCVLFRAFKFDSTEVQYCGCQGLTCNELSPNRHEGKGLFSISLPTATCQDAGRYVCQTEEIDTQVSEAQRSLEMLPDEVELFAKLSNMGHSRVVYMGSVLNLRCTVFSTLPVTFAWTYQDPSLNRWFVVREDMATISHRSPPLHSRCELPWNSILERVISVTDQQRLYRCHVSYTHQGADYMSWSPVYSLNTKVHLTAQDNFGHKVPDRHEDSANGTELFGARRSVILQQQNSGMSLQEPQPDSAVTPVLACLGVLVVCGMLCLTVLLFTESDILQRARALLIYRSSSAPSARQAASGPASRLSIIQRMTHFFPRAGSRDERRTARHLGNRDPFFSLFSFVQGDSGSPRGVPDRDRTWLSLNLTQDFDSWLEDSHTGMTFSTSAALNTVPLNNAADTSSALNGQSDPITNTATTSAPSSPVAVHLNDLNEKSTQAHTTSPYIAPETTMGRKYTAATAATSERIPSNTIPKRTNVLIATNSLVQEKNSFIISTDCPTRTSTTVTKSTGTTVVECSIVSTTNSNSSISSAKSVEASENTSGKTAASINALQKTGVITATSNNVPENNVKSAVLSHPDPQNLVCNKIL